MIRPPLLSPGAIIDLVAPACPIDAQSLKQACQWIETQGWVPRYDEVIVQPDKAQAPPQLPFLYQPEARYAHWLRALSAPDSQAIWCVRGGYGAMRIMAALAQRPIPTQPKWLVGYSDITVLHLLFNQLWGLQTLHAEMFNRFKMPEVVAALDEAATILSGELATRFELVPLNQQTATVGPKPIMAGNLTLWHCSIGTPWALKAVNHCLIIEEIGEKAYQIDRMLCHLSQAGCFKGAGALIFADCLINDAVEQAHIHSIIERFAKACDVPCYRMAGVGHGVVNRPVVNHSFGLIEKNILSCQWTA